MKWTNETRNVYDLIPATYNPRKMSSKQKQDLQASLDRFDLCDPVVINKNNRVIGGHQRLRLLKERGIKTVDVRVPDEELSLKQEQELNLRLNKNHASFDEELLGSLDLDLLSLVGFDEKDIKDILPQEDPETDSVPEIEKNKYGVVRGDVWLMDKHRLLCGDATNMDDVSLLMGGSVADMFLSDPPYNVDYEGKTEEKLKIDNDKKTDKDFLQFLKDSFISANTFLKQGGVFYVWHADSEGYNFRLACKDAGWKVRECLIWNKNCMVMGRQDYQWKHEPCLYGWKDGAAHYWGNDRSQTTVIDFNKPSRNKEHPTMKPVGLLEYQIQNSSRRGEVVMDLFLGSGSTLLACEKTGRVCFGTELDEHYCSVIIKRWEDLTGKRAVKANG